MRLLLLSDVTSPGGVDTHLAALAGGAQLADLDVDLLVDNSSLTPQRKAQLRSSGARLHQAPIYHRSCTPAQQRSAVRALAKQRKPNVVHVVCGIPWSCLELREEVVELGLPLIFTEAFVPRGLVIEPPVRERIAALHERASAVIFLCHENREVLRDEHRISSSRSVVIPSAVELRPKHRVLRAHLGDHDTFRLVVTARLVHQKGIDILLEAARILRDRTDFPFTLDLFGEGPERAELERQMRDHRLEDLVFFRGWTQDVVERLPEFDCYVLPSRSEGLPFALLEAMAAGVPVIATAVSGIPEAVADGAAGVLVPPEDPDALAQAIASMRSDPAGRRERAQRAIVHVADCHNVQQSTEDHLEIWRRVAQRD